MKYAIFKALSKPNFLHTAFIPVTKSFSLKKMCVKWKQDDTGTGAVALLEDNDFLFGLRCAFH